MRPSIRLGRILGIEIGLHYSWFIIALLIVLSLAGHFHMVNPQWNSGTRWSLAVVTALVLRQYRGARVVPCGRRKSPRNSGEIDYVVRTRRR